MSDIGPGDTVLCVDTLGPKIESWEPTLGGIYHVLEVDEGCGDGPVCELAEDPDKFKSDWAWPLEMFRKLRPDEHEPCEEEFTQLIRKMKPHRQREDA